MSEATSRRLRRSKLRKVLLEQISREANWITNATYAVDHGTDADAIRTVLERQAEQTVLFRCDDLVRAEIAYLMAQHGFAETP